MKRKNFLLSVAALTVSASLVIAGCADMEGQQIGADEGAFKASLPTDTKGYITVAGHYNNFESLENEFVRFNEIYPDIELDYVFLDNYNETIIPALSSEEAPDIYYLPLWMIEKEKYEGVIDSAEDLAGDDTGIDMECLREGLIYRDKDGAVPMVPVFSSAFGMLVNKDLFEKEGLSIPESYSELIQVCDSFKEKGYKDPILTYNDASHMLYAMIYPYFCAQVQQNADRLDELNGLDAGAKEMLRSSLQLTEDFMEHGFVDTKACDDMDNAYEPMILRFFEGDIPMMFADGDTVSGTGKRESMSDAFTASPFSYGFYPIPTTEDGGYFLDFAPVSLAVNKNSQSLSIVNEFMRFLISTPELGNMAQQKRLMTPTDDMSLDSIYSSFGDVKEDKVVYRQNLGLIDDPVVEMRIASWAVANKLMTVDEAVDAFGHLKETYADKQ